MDRAAIEGQDSAWRSRWWPDNRCPSSLYSSARGLSRRDIVRLIRTFSGGNSCRFYIIIDSGDGRNEPVIGNAIIQNGGASIVSG